jgi:drug/metabolite transporter superfamily protein YnfA
MKTAVVTLASLVIAAALESGGDAAIRKGLDAGGAPIWLALGASLLVLYGFVVNFYRVLDFSTVMGGYIAVFFVVSQTIAVVMMHDRLTPTTLLGGLLIVGGGAIVQWGALSRIAA